MRKKIKMQVVLNCCVSCVDKYQAVPSSQRKHGFLFFYKAANRRQSSEGNSMLEKLVFDF